MPELLSVGYAAIDQIERNDYFGGAAAGIAINGKGFGIDTGLLALFGTDERSVRYTNLLNEIGVDITLSPHFSDISIPINEIVELNQIGEWHDNGVAELSPHVVVSGDEIEPYKVVHLASAHYGLAKNVARKREGLLTYTPGPKLLKADEYLHLDVLRRSQILFLNELEWQRAKSILNVSGQNEVLDYGPKVVVTTLGSRGATVHYRDSQDQEVFVPTQKREHVDTTGAGDAFSLGFIISYVRKLPLEKCAEIGTILSSHAIKRNGVIIPQQDIDEAIKKMQSYGIVLR